MSTFGESRSPLQSLRENLGAGNKFNSSSSIRLDFARGIWGDCRKSMICPDEGRLGVGAVLPAARVGDFAQLPSNAPNAVSAESAEVYCRMHRKVGQWVGVDCEVKRFTFGDRNRQYSHRYLAEAWRRVGKMIVRLLRADLVAVIDGQAPVVFLSGIKSLGCWAAASHPGWANHPIQQGIRVHSARSKVSLILAAIQVHALGSSKLRISSSSKTEKSEFSSNRIQSPLRVSRSISISI